MVCLREKAASESPKIKYWFDRCMNDHGCIVYMTMQSCKFVHRLCIVPNSPSSCVMLLIVSEKD